MAFLDRYWPLTPAEVTEALEVGRVSAGDTVLDLGSGDGRIVMAAAAR